VVDEDGEALRAGQLDREHIDARQGLGNLLADLALQRSLLVVDVRQNRSPSEESGLLTKNGRYAPISPSGEMWCDKDSKASWAVGPAAAGPCPSLDGRGLSGLVALEVPDHVGDVCDLLFEVALVLLQPGKPLFAAGEAAVAEAEAAAPSGMSVSVHVHLPSS
jgi:hypothetical protein